MKLAIIGYGKMGHAIEALAAQRGHVVACTIDNEEEWRQRAEQAKACDVAVEFSQPACAVNNIRHSFDLNLPVVCGTTGWYDQLDAVVTDCREHNQALFVASNFSIGMNIMFELNRRLAQLMAARPDYHVSLSETHHIHKLDAPSGTAITLAQDINRICHSERMPVGDIVSVREGEVPGIHEVVYDSDIDTLTLRHSAKSRQGLAAGALLAAEFLCGRKGYYTMRDLLSEA